MKWFRFYSEALHDPKVRRLPAGLFKDWVLILCIANEGKPRGVLPGIVDIGYHFNRSPERVKALLVDLQGRGFLDETGGDFMPHNWGGRQFTSANGPKRVKKPRRGSTALRSRVVRLTTPEAEAEQR